MHYPWRRYLALRSTGHSGMTPPMLAPPGAPGVYFTDRDSLIGAPTAAEFARRLGLSAGAQAECQFYGCAIVEFDIPASSVTLPSPATGCAQGLTAGGAREWVTNANLPLSGDEEVMYVDATSTGQPRWFNLPL